MLRLVLVLVCFSCSSFAQYDEYQTYETFSELDKYQRDYGLIFAPSFIYTRIEENNTVSGATVSDRTRALTFYDLRLGYIFRGGFYFGLLYTGETQDINNGIPQNTREALGMSFGIIKKGWAFTGTLFPHSKQELSNTSDISTYSEGLGFQIDGAYYFRIGRHFSIGPQLVFKSFRYGKAEDATTSVNSDATSQHDVFTPMISMLFNIYRG